MKCPDCGSKLVKLKNSRHECRSERCPVIEVRMSKRKGTQVFRDAVVASARVKSKKRLKGRGNNRGPANATLLPL